MLRFSVSSGNMAFGDVGQHTIIGMWEEFREFKDISKILVDIYISLTRLQVGRDRLVAGTPDQKYDHNRGGGAGHEYPKDDARYPRHGKPVLILMLLVI
jgi:hypothetical protein